MKLAKDFDRIPTLYDDITKEIMEAKFKSYYEQQADRVNKGTYKLGDVLDDALGKLLDKIV